MKAKLILVKEQFFDGQLNEKSFEIIEENVPELLDGEFLAEAEFIGVSPYMKVLTSYYPAYLEKVRQELKEALERDRLEEEKAKKKKAKIIADSASDYTEADELTADDTMSVMDTPSFMFPMDPDPWGTSAETQAGVEETEEEEEVIPPLKSMLMPAEQVAKIIDSKHPDFPIGQYVLAEFGWRTHTVSDGSPGKIFDFSPQVLPDYGELPRSLALGILGMAGNAALFGFLNICQPPEDKTVVISAADGTIGLHVGQLAKMSQCYAVGITDSIEKGQRLVEEVGFDDYVNLNAVEFEKKLIEATPNKIDVYFDNIGGDVTSIVIERMNKNGVMVICGSISQYNSEGRPQNIEELRPQIKARRLRVEGFHAKKFKETWSVGIETNLKLIQSEQIQYFETVTEDFENVPKAFLSMLEGETFGQCVVSV